MDSSNQVNIFTPFAKTDMRRTRGEGLPGEGIKEKEKEIRRSIKENNCPERKGKRCALRA